MISLILAAGYGARMRPYTDHTHKTLLPVAGQPLIDRMIDNLRSVGVHTHLVVTGYRADELCAHLRETFADDTFLFVHNPRYAETNNIVSLALAFEHLPAGQDVLLLESDVVCGPDLLQMLVDSPWRDVALVDHYGTGMDGTVVTVTDGVITAVIPPHLQGADFDFHDKYKTLNIYKFSAEFCRDVFAGLLRWYAHSMDGNVYYELILGMLIYMRRATVHAQVVEGHRWAELDDPGDLRVAEYTFAPDRRREVLEDWWGGYWSLDVVDFCFLRNMYWPTPAMLGEMRRNLPQLLWNYGSAQHILDQKLTWWLQCREGRVTALAGLSQVFPLLRHAFSGKRALVPSPTFGEYARVFPNADRYADTFHIDLAAVEAQAQAGDAEVVVVVTPNNPTGTTVAAADLHALAKRHPQRVFVIDESFQGFSSDPSLTTLLDTAPLDNVLVLVSLSKVMGVPGARLGYVYTCNAEWTARLRG